MHSPSDFDFDAPRTPREAMVAELEAERIAPSGNREFAPERKTMAPVIAIACLVLVALLGWGIAIGGESEADLETEPLAVPGSVVPAGEMPTPDPVGPLDPVATFPREEPPSGYRYTALVSTQQQLLKRLIDTPEVESGRGAGVTDSSGKGIAVFYRLKYTGDAAASMDETPADILLDESLKRLKMAYKVTASSKFTVGGHRVVFVETPSTAVGTAYMRGGTTVLAMSPDLKTLESFLRAYLAG